MLPFQKYKNNNDQKRSTFVEMPSEAQYAIFHEGKSKQCIERKPAIVNTGRNGIFAVENRTKSYTSQFRSLWITRARALHVRKSQISSSPFTSASVTSSQSVHTRFITFKFSHPRNIRISTGSSLM